MVLKYFWSVFTGFNVSMYGIGNWMWLEWWSRVVSGQPSLSDNVSRHVLSPSVSGKFKRQYVRRLGCGLNENIVGHFPACGHWINLRFHGVCLLIILRNRHLSSKQNKFQFFYQHHVLDDITKVVRWFDFRTIYDGLCLGLFTWGFFVTNFLWPIFLKKELFLKIACQY